LKIQYSNCYIQIPSDNVEMLELASAVLEFFIDYFKNKEETLETPTKWGARVASLRVSGKATRKSVLDVILSGCEETTNEPGRQARVCG
jgi:hypothetical protein